MKTYTMQNTEGFTQKQLDELNAMYKKQSVLLDSTDENYDNNIQNLQERILNEYM
jgi:hypothetical protein